jgi:ribA/ribD-fused uncharacterized protein
MRLPIRSFTAQYAFLSNFYPFAIMYEFERYPTVEHAFQAAKVLDPIERHRFAELSSPGQAKKLGRSVRLRPDWESVKLGIMKQLLELKFEDPHMRELLNNTKPAELIEGNWWGDTYWGVCNDVGKNHLGILLMEVRDAG